MAAHPAAATENGPPDTVEGWYVLHDCYHIDWLQWQQLAADERARLADGLAAWLTDKAGVEHGDTQAFSVLTQKGDLLFLHYREQPQALNHLELELRKLPIWALLDPAWSYLSVIELSLAEAAAIARKRVAESGEQPGTAGYEQAYAAELDRQKAALEQRRYRRVPERSHLCWYPMNKRRGEQENWYTLGNEERRRMMRGHGRLGHKYHRDVTQVISSSVGLDDWEWMVDLHADDPLIFKKLVYEMRFDEVSARFAEFGAFFVGLKRTPEEVAALLRG